ncbi:PREDICTED: elongation factor 1-alpha isoform X2 [Nelumbo nucifera]|uniref:Elongation factor 1-alpha isoform X2 n=1 Tax=Nelumbo nucifera TaxID=4432 RepID=A0A1U8QBU2_NELNU|nr:PREDICTED: elongation factor 1-alpha isoform X2 [Nelumbo nucifera]
MPRKVNYGLDYDEDYDMYDDYDYDYDHDSDVERDGGMLEVRQAIAKPGIWRCSICTYDNDESMPVCDICGVFRNPPVNVSSTGSKKTDPFKFDRPSPDDLVSEGKNSSRKVSKGVPSNANEKVGTVKLPHAKKSECSLVSLPKGLLSTTNENVGTYKMPNVKSIEGSSVSLPKGSQFHADESICSSVNEEKPQSLASSFTDVTLSEKSGSSKTVNSKRATSHAEYKPEKWMLPEQNEGILTQLNLAIVGHVDSGKSTLSGRLLHLLGRISQKEMHKFEKEAKLKGKGSFAYAWALDESAEERERGITMTVAVAYFDSKKYHVVVLDSPGHKDFVPNMISGATQADAAILVIDASVGSFETGMDSNGGQTREHAQLIRSFGVDEIIVGINKMDAVSYSKERFDTIKMQLGTFLRSCGFKDSFVSWIPLSAMENQNLVKAASDIRLSSWYQGSHLLDAIDSLHPPIRDTVKPLRMPICDVIRSHLQGQVAASGKLESGAIRSGSKVLVMPSGDVATVRSLERDSQCCTIARAGDNVAVSLQGIDGGRVMAGGVLCHPDFPVAVATRLELKVLVLDIVMPILVGSQIEFHIYHAKEAARVVRIISLIDQKTGKVTKKAPRCLTSKQSAVIEVVLDGAVCVEEFSKCRALGRVFLRSSGRTIAVGIVSRIIEQ